MTMITAEPSGEGVRITGVPSAMVSFDYTFQETGSQRSGNRIGCSVVG